MLVNQISVFVENKSGRLSEIISHLEKNNINIRAISIADTTDFGILRMIVDKPDVAEKVLKDSGHTVKSTQVIVISVSDKPGGLANALSILRDAGVAIEYMYAFLSKPQGEALVILRVNKEKEAITALQANNITVVPADVVYTL